MKLEYHLKPKVDLNQPGSAWRPSDILDKGISIDSDVVKDDIIETYNYFAVPLSRETIQSKFRNLAATWKFDNVVTSSPSSLVSDQSYQEIIGMGPTILPHLLEELRNNPDEWFWALRAIAQENPVKPEHQGNFKAMTNDWIQWGKEKGHIE